MLAEKKLVPKFRSQKSIAAAAERTGTASRRRIAVMNSAQTGSGKNGTAQSSMQTAVAAMQSGSVEMATAIAGVNQ